MYEKFGSGGTNLGSEGRRAPRPQSPPQCAGFFILMGAVWEYPY